MQGAVCIRYDANIIIRKVRSPSAFDGEGFAQLFLNGLVVVPRKGKAALNRGIQIGKTAAVRVHRIADGFQLVFRCRLSVHRSGSLHIPSPVGQVVHRAGSAIDSDLAGLNGAGGPV